MVEILPHITNMAISVHMGIEVNLKKFAHTHWNCVVKKDCTWRLTFYSKDFTVNMYQSGYFILFTQTLTLDAVSNEMIRLFGVVPKCVTLRNLVVKYYYPYTVDLDRLYDELGGSTIDDLFSGNDPCTAYGGHRPIVMMDRQSFSALRLRPFGDSKTTFSIFSSGAINTAGLKSQDDLERATLYINKTLVPLLDSIGLTKP